MSWLWKSKQWADFENVNNQLTLGFHCGKKAHIEPDILIAHSMSAHTGNIHTTLLLKVFGAFIERYAMFTSKDKSIYIYILGWAQWNLSRFEFKFDDTRHSS